MKSFPMFIKTSGRRVVIIGGGEQAAQKARLMLKTDAQLVLLAHQLEPELQDLAVSGRAHHHGAAIAVADIQGAAMAFVATGCPGMDAALQDIVRAAHVPVNVVDQPALCDVITPSIVDRDPVVVAIGTEGTAPVLARSIKTRVEEMLDPSLGAFSALAGRLRGAVAARVPQSQRRAFWRWAFLGAPWRAHQRGSEREAAMLLKTAIAEGQAPDAEQAGVVSMIDTRGGASDLLTLRAVARLQEADILYCDAGIASQILELARRDAERVHLDAAAPADQLSRMIAEQVAQGRRAVHLRTDAAALPVHIEAALERADLNGGRVEWIPAVSPS